MFLEAETVWQQAQACDQFTCSQPSVTEHLGRGLLGKFLEHCPALFQSSKCLLANTGMSCMHVVFNTGFHKAANVEAPGQQSLCCVQSLSPEPLNAGFADGCCYRPLKKWC